MKNFNQYCLIKESFHESKEFYDFLNTELLDKSFFTDSLLEISDIGDKVSVNFDKFIVDRRGHTVFHDIRADETYFAYYRIIIEYRAVESGKFDSFKKKTEDLNTISTCVEEMVDRASDKLKVKDNKYTVDKKNIGDQPVLIYTFRIIITDELDTKKLKDAFDSYNARYTAHKSYAKGYVPEPDEDDIDEDEDDDLEGAEGEDDVEWQERVRARDAWGGYARDDEDEDEEDEGAPEVPAPRRYGDMFLPGGRVVQRRRIDDDEEDPY